MAEQTEDLRIIRISTAGSVDDGKSTLIGRLLYDTKSIFEDQYEALKRTSEHRGESEVNLALLTDGLRAEREQGITIDVAYRYFATPKRRFIVADTPGHQQYTRNMITGASTADAALILIDARHGMTDQSKRHAFIASLLRVPQVVIVVNKMDLVGFEEHVFESIKRSFVEFSSKLDLPNVQFIPISALLGDNVVDKSGSMPWYTGPPVLDVLENLQDSARRSPPELRLPVQLVLRPHQDFRGFAGQLASGAIRQGEELTVIPSGQKARVKQLFDLDSDIEEATVGTNIVLTLDREVDISRGDMLARPGNLPSITQEFEAVICWMNEQRAVAGKPYVLRHTTREVSATLTQIVYRFDVETLHRDPVHTLDLNDIGRVVVSTGKPIFIDTYEHNRNTGGFLLIDPVSNTVVAAGMVTRTSRASAAQENVREAEVVWMTGLSGAGKSTIADALVERLRLEGIQAARLDGDDLRTGLNSDLGFSPEDRNENLRRAAHVARLYSGLGNVTVCSFITPTNADRRLVREILGNREIELFVKTSLATAEERDPKGLYKRARAGEIPQFTGITAPFEEPEAANLVIDTEQTPVQQAVEQILNAILQRRRQ